MNKYLLLGIAIFVSVYLFYTADDSEVSSKKSDSDLIEVINISNDLSINDSLLEDEVSAVKFNEPATVKIKALPKLPSIINMRRFIDEKPLEERSSEEIISLAKSLQMCGLLPLKNKNKIAGLEHNQYFYTKTPQQYKNFKNWVAECQKATLSEILGSYDLLIEQAKLGDFRAVNALSNSHPPKYLEVSINGGEIETELNIEEVRKSHLEKTLPILKESVKQGNIKAALTLAFDLNKGVIQERDSVQSLSLYLAIRNIMNTEKYDKNIESIQKNISHYDFEEAKRKSKILSTLWSSKEFVYY